MIKSIGVEITDKAFLPEAYAYRNYFMSQGFKCEIVRKGTSEALSYDAVVLFHGFHPFWKSYPRYIIGEYHSLSTGRCSRAKDLLKRLLNVRSDILVFLNDSVRVKMWFSSNRKYALRGMGYDGSSFNNPKVLEKDFDIVYAGSIRPGVLDYCEYFSLLGLSVAVVGNDKVYRKGNLTCFGKVSPCMVRGIMLRAKNGLNYTPDVFPLNIQDSTKVIEYCSLGLGLITNRYQWVDDFEKNRKARFMDIDSIKSINDIRNFEFIVPDVTDLEWNTILRMSCIVDRIQEL